MRIGQFTYTKRGVSRFDLRDPYHLAVTLTWPQFMALLLGTYLCLNFLFATLYVAVPNSIANAHAGSLADAFFFSFETLATVGYGEMYPASLYGHVIACAEIVIGLAFTAIMTGLTFVRFSRPRAKFLLADKLVVCQHNAVPTLMLRVGNGRLAPMGEAKAKLHVLLGDVTAEGVTFRRVHELRLLRAHLPLFPLTWTMMHVMDEASPLFGFTSERLIEGGANMFLTLEARDPTLDTTVHEMRTYGPSDVLFGMRYVDAIGTDADGSPTADMTLIGTVEPDVGVKSIQQVWSDRETVAE